MYKRRLFSNRIIK